MKKSTLLLLTLLLTLGINTQAQRASAKKTDVATVRKVQFAREKFDPVRDPNLDLQNAVKKASASGKRIILDVGGEWCGWCVYMDRFFVENPSLARRRDKNFVWVKINYSDENENAAFLAAYPAITAFPHLFVLSGDGKLLASKDTAELEDGKRYDLTKFMQFLKTWIPE